MDLVSLNSERILEALKLNKMHLQEMSMGVITRLGKTEGYQNF